MSASGGVSGGEVGVTLLVVSALMVAVQASTTDERIQTAAGIAVLAAIALPLIVSGVHALVSHVRAVALEAAARRGQVLRLPLAAVSDTTSVGEETK